jgi:hypothetical protein
MDGDTSIIAWRRTPRHVIMKTLVNIEYFCVLLEHPIDTFGARVPCSPVLNHAAKKGEMPCHLRVALMFHPREAYTSAAHCGLLLYYPRVCRLHMPKLKN